jgi:hypothetical protein
MDSAIDELAGIIRSCIAMVTADATQCPVQLISGDLWLDKAAEPRGIAACRLLRARVQQGFRCPLKKLILATDEINGTEWSGTLTNRLCAAQVTCVAHCTSPGERDALTWRFLSPRNGVTLGAAA